MFKKADSNRAFSSFFHPGVTDKKVYRGDWTSFAGPVPGVVFRLLRQQHLTKRRMKQKSLTYKLVSKVQKLKFWAVF